MDFLRSGGVIFLLAMTTEIWAQLPVFDRPGVAETPFVPKRNSIQLEVGEDFFNSRLLPYQLQVPSVMVRVSPLKNMEVRIQYAYALYHYTWLNEISRVRDPWVTGLKYTFFTSRDSSFRLAGLYHFKFGKVGAGKRNGHDLIASFQKDYEDFSLNGNVGFMSFNGLENKLMMAFCASATLGDDFSIYAEPFVFISSEKTSPGMDGGVLYFPDEESQIDISLGVFDADSPQFFLGIGYSKCWSW